MDLAILEQKFVVTTFGLSLISFLIFLISFIFKRKNKDKLNHLDSFGYVMMLVAGISSILALATKAIATKHVPWSNFYETLILLSVLTIFFTLVIYKVYKHELLGLISSPAIVIILGIATLLPPSFKTNTPLVPALEHYWIKIHVTAMIASYSCFLLATATAIAYLIIHSKFNKPLLVSENNDSKEVEDVEENQHLIFLDELTHNLILFGFPILTFGIITGSIWANHAWGSYWSWDPKETSSLVTWLIYAGYLHSKRNTKFDNKTSNIFVLIGFLAVLFTYYGVNFLPGLHSYGFNS